MQMQLDDVLVFLQIASSGSLLGGAVIVIAAGVLVILRERHLRIKRGKARQHVTKYG